MTIIATPTLIPHDAVGNDVRGMHQAIYKSQEACIYATDYTEDGYSTPFLIDKTLLYDLLQDKSTTLIYHHSIYWPEGEEILSKARCQVILKYHNITPSEFFAPYNDMYAKICRDGREQTERLLRYPSIRLWADSLYNANELQELGGRDIAIIPPFHKIEDFQKARIDTDFAKELLQYPLNILFVGRFAPNKGHEHLLKTIACYKKKYNDDIHLHIAGSLDRSGLGSYIDYIHYWIDRLGIADLVTIYDKLSFDRLVTLYRTSHIFLLLSEHEGFCVPVLEAQLNKLPIIALDRGAVSETLGDNQLYFQKIDYERFADTIHILQNNFNYTHYLINQGAKNVQRFSLQILEQRLLCLIK